MEADKVGDGATKERTACGHYVVCYHNWDQHSNAPGEVRKSSHKKSGDFMCVVQGLYV